MSRTLMVKLANLANTFDANGMGDHADLIDIAIYAAQNGNPEIALDIFEDMAGISTKTAGILDVLRDQSKLVDNLTDLLAERAEHSLSFYSFETRKIINALEKALGRIQLPNGQTALDGMSGYINSINAALSGQEKNPNKALEMARSATSEIKEYARDPEAYDRALAEKAEREKWNRRSDEARRMRGEDIQRADEEAREEAREEAEAIDLLSDEDEKLIAEYLSEGWTEDQISSAYALDKDPIDLENSLAVMDHRKMISKMDDYVERVRDYVAMSPAILGRIKNKGWSVDDYIAWNIAGQFENGYFDQNNVLGIMQAKGLTEQAPAAEPPAPVPAAKPLAPVPAAEQPIEKEFPAPIPTETEDPEEKRQQEPEPVAEPVALPGPRVPWVPIISSNPEIYAALKPFASEGKSIPMLDPDDSNFPAIWAKDRLLREIKELISAGILGEDEDADAGVFMNLLDTLGVSEKRLDPNEAAEVAQAHEGVTQTTPQKSHTEFMYPPSSQPAEPMSKTQISSELRSIEVALEGLWSEDMKIRKEPNPMVREKNRAVREKKREELERRKAELIALKQPVAETREVTTQRRSRGGMLLIPMSDGLEAPDPMLENS